MDLVAWEERWKEKRHPGDGPLETDLSESREKCSGSSVHVQAGEVIKTFFYLDLPPTGRRKKPFPNCDGSRGKGRDEKTSPSCSFFYSPGLVGDSRIRSRSGRTAVTFIFTVAREDRNGGIACVRKSEGASPGLPENIFGHLI